MRGRMQIPGSAFRLSPSLELFTSGPEIIFIPFSTTNRISNVNSVEQLSFSHRTIAFHSESEI